MIKTTIWRQVVIAALLAGGSFTVAANPPPPPPVSYGVEEDVFHPVRARQGMVASVDALATRVGVDILRQGGNAVDAAVAVGYALAVTHPQAAGYHAMSLPLSIVRRRGGGSLHARTDR